MIKTREALAACIDQTLLGPAAGRAFASDWLSASAGEGFAALCVSPFLVPLARERIVKADTAVWGRHAGQTSTKLCSVCGFPLGFATTDTKAAEAACLVRLGCLEIDMVMNVAAFLEGDVEFVRDDIAAVVRAVEESSLGCGIVKVILETGYLDAPGITQACHIVAAAGADFVKTCTGFGPRGATLDDVRTMHTAVGGALGIKAAGGIRDLDTALAMLEAGATRIGASSGLEILAAFSARQG